MVGLIIRHIQSVDNQQRLVRVARFGQRHGVVQTDDGRGLVRQETPVKRSDLWPVGGIGGVQGGDCSLDLELAGFAAGDGSVECFQTLGQHRGIPEAAILLAGG